MRFEINVAGGSLHLDAIHHYIIHRHDCVVIDYCDKAHLFYETYTGFGATYISQLLKAVGGIG